MFQCYSEVKDDRPQVEAFFDGGVIDLSDQRLLPTDINTLRFFLLRANKKQWNELNLSCCKIGDVGCNILVNAFGDKKQEENV